MKSLADILKGRPSHQVFNPPVDLPLDETTGAAPPYPFPPELIHELAGKSESEVSSLLSKFRNGLSEHRTHLSEHRTDLSEHRTDLSGFRSELSQSRTDMSKLRTELSQHRTELSEHRTKLSDTRSLLSNERTHLGYVRTALSLMTFGVSLNRFAIFLVQGGRVPANGEDRHALLLRMHSTEQLGLGMVLLGVAVLLWSLVRYRRVNAQIMQDNFRPSGAAVLLVSLGVIALGAVSAIVLMLT